jgi:hypothetical protein
MVSPPYKAGQQVAQLFAASSSGEAAVFSSVGVFAESPSGLALYNGYLAQRSADGWMTSPLDPPATLSPIGRPGDPEDVSPDLGRSVTLLRFVPNSTTRVPSTEAFYLREPNGAFVEASPRMHALNGGEGIPEVSFGSASADLSHITFGAVQALLPVDDTTPGLHRLYEVAGAGGISPSLKLVGVDQQGKAIDPHCEAFLGSGGVSKFRAVSRDGSEVFFTANVNPSEEESTGCDEPTEPGEHPADPAELFVRIDGSQTLEVSKPLSEPCVEVPCPGAAGRATAVFQGASLDGSKVFFTTIQSLVGADRDSANDLYEAEIANGAVRRLVLISEGDQTDATRGEGAEVQGVTRISDDGSHVYFVARGVLTASPNGLGQTAVAKADNLYVYDTSTGETKFVAELCSGGEESGSVTGVTQCPSSESDERLLWFKHDNRHAQSTPDGRFLIFDTYARLVRAGPEADTDAAIDVYRYDSQTGGVVRVSVGSEGNDNNGNGEFDATISAPLFLEGFLRSQNELTTRAVSEDGSTIVFTTAEPLSLQAINGQPDVYAWHEGHVGLISDGHSPTPDEEPVISLSGRDIFFETSEGLVAQDTDGVRDVYDARIGGGFAVAPVTAGGCAGAACRGPSSIPFLLGAPDSATFSGLGDPPPSTSTPDVKTKTHKKKRRSGKRKARSGKRKARSGKRNAKRRKARRRGATGKSIGGRSR